MATTEPWSAVIDGTATGPKESIPTDNGGDIGLLVLWSNTEGIVLDVDLPDDPLTSADLCRLAARAAELSQMPKPDAEGV